jgi:hypothetical protein
VRRYANTVPYIQYVTADVEKTCFSIVELIYLITLTLNQRKCEMKSFDDMKSEMEAIQQKMVEAKKNECANALKK